MPCRRRQAAAAGLTRFQALSGVYGTGVAIEEGVGVIRRK